MKAHMKLLLRKIERGEVISASRDWMTLVSLAEIGAVVVRRADNGQVEYLRVDDGAQIRVGP